MQQLGTIGAGASSSICTCLLSTNAVPAWTLLLLGNSTRWTSCFLHNTRDEALKRILSRALATENDGADPRVLPLELLPTTINLIASNLNKSNLPTHEQSQPPRSTSNKINLISPIYQLPR